MKTYNKTKRWVRKNCHRDKKSQEFNNHVTIWKRFVRIIHRWTVPHTAQEAPIAAHYSDVIMSAIASQITGVSIDCSTACPGADQRKHQSSASLAFCEGFTSLRTSDADNMFLSIYFKWLTKGVKLVRENILHWGTEAFSTENNSRGYFRFHNWLSLWGMMVPWIFFNKMFTNIPFLSSVKLL